jgi:hypothetical protein
MDVSSYYMTHDILYLYSFAFLGTFAKLQKETITFIMSIHLSICMEQLSSHWTDFDETWYLHFFQKSVEKVQVSLKSG